MAADFSYMEYKEEEPVASGASSRVGLDRGELEELFRSFSSTRDTKGTVEFGRLPFMLRCLGCSDVDTNSIFGKVKGACVQDTSVPHWLFLGSVTHPTIFARISVASLHFTCNCTC